MKFINYINRDILSEFEDNLELELLYFAKVNYRYIFPHDGIKNELPTLFVRSYLELIQEKLFKKHKILTKTTKWRSYQFDRNLSLKDKFINLMVRQGKLIKHRLYFTKVLYFFKYHFYYYNMDFHKSFKNYLNYFTSAQYFNYMLKPSFFLSMIIQILDPLLELKVTKVPKKFRKKNKKKYAIALKFINRNRRFKFVLKQIIEYSNSILIKDISSRWFSSLLFTILQLPEGYLASKKLEVYQYALKLYKNRKLNLLRL